MAPNVGIEPTFTDYKSVVIAAILIRKLERVVGIEPTLPAWKAGVIAAIPYPQYGGE